MDTLGQLFGSSSAMAAQMADSPVPASAAIPTGSGAGFSAPQAFSNMLGGANDALGGDTLNNLMKIIGTVRSLVPTPAAAPSVPAMARRGGGSVPSPTALQFLKTLQAPGGSANPQMS